jgi:hypothetical protein
MDPAALKDALAAGRAIAHREHGVRLGFIIDIPAESRLDGADATVGFLRDHAPAGTLAIGLAGLEQAAPQARAATTRRSVMRSGAVPALSRRPNCSMVVSTSRLTSLIAVRSARCAKDRTPGPGGS